MKGQNHAARKRSYNTISPYLLTSCIKNRKWDSVKLYIQQANLPDENSSYALHLVCQDLNAPLYIIRMIYFAFPDAAVYLDASRRTPLFIAVEIFFVDAAVFLTHQSPEAALIRNGIGMTPIQYALEDFEPNQILSAILASNPMATQQLDNEGETILKSFFNERNCYLRSLLENNHTLLSDSQMEMKRWATQSVHSKCILMLKAVTTDNFSQYRLDNDEWLAVHASCQVDTCPWSFCNLLLQMHPEQAMKQDDDGNLPIHIIVSVQKKLSDENTINCYFCGPVEKLYYAPCEENTFLGLCENCHCSKIQNDEKEMCCMEPVQKVNGVLKDLILLNPKMAAVPDRRGNYPLNISISNQQNFISTKIIFDAAPGIGRKPDAVDGLLAFMSAAVGDWDDEIDQITTIFYLLHEDPVLVKNYTDGLY